MTTPHPNADLLRAIADGKQMQGRVPEDGCDWFDIYPDQAIGAIASDYSMDIRIKPDVAGAFSAGAALSTAAQPLTQDEQENQLCMSSASCGQASTNESAFITSTQRSAGTFSASSERQSYRDSDGMPTERAVLEREWRRMKIALSATAAQPPAADLAGDGDSTKDEISMIDNKQYPELPTHFMLVQESFRDEVYLYTADQMRAYVDADRAMRAQAAPQPAVQQGTDIGPLGQRTILDAIRSAYDLGYSDARNARTHPGDSAPGYKGRDVEKDHGGALIAKLNVLAARIHPAAPAAQGDALDHGVREELSIGKAINRAARDLPEGWEIRIDLERGAGVVHLTDPEGNETMIDGSGELFSDQINAAIDAALTRAQKDSND